MSLQLLAPMDDMFATHVRRSPSWWMNLWLRIVIAACLGIGLLLLQ